MGLFAAFPNGGYPIDLTFGPDHNLYVVSQSSIHGVFRFNGTTGALIDTFVPNGSGGLSNPFGIAFFPTTPSATNHPPILVCPTSAIAECGAPAAATIAVADPDGDALTIVWTLNGTVVQTDAVPSGARDASTNLAFSAVLPLGTNLLLVAATDTATNTVSCSTTINVIDVTPPVISGASVAPNVLWPPNHKWVPVTVRAQATDDCGSATWQITDVSSNEAGNGPADGNTPTDWAITGDHTVNLRAERSGNGRGRIYSITIQASDQDGNLSTGTILTVTVPR